ERKLAVAQRSYKLLTEKFGLGPEDIIFDPLVFPCATGDENYIGGAVETIEGIRLIKLDLPDARKLERFASIPQHERDLAENLLFSHPPKDVPADHSQAELLRNVPADWREQKKEQRAAVNQYHIASIAEYFRTAK